MNVRHIFEALIREKKWWKPTDRVLLAVSGGVDSMVLLHLMQSLPDDLRPVLAVAHINHQLRDESAEEEAFIRHYCQERELRLFVARWLEGPNMKTQIEQKAREFRYAFFKATMEEHHFSILATAHHQGDQVETMLMRLINGNSLSAITGIQDVRPFGEGQLIRPLLKLDKPSLYEYAKEYNVPYYEDDTNHTDVYLRNRIRRQVIPKLEEENPRFTQHMQQFREELIYANQLVSERVAFLYDASITQTDTGWELNRSLFVTYTEAERYFLIDALADCLYKEQAIVLSRRIKKGILTQCMGKKPNQQIALPKKWVCERSYEKINIYQKKEKTVSSVSSQPLLLNKGVYLNKGEWLVWTDNTLECVPIEVRNWSKKEILLYQEVEGPLIVRKSQPGDRMIFNQSGQTKKVSRYFIDEKISHSAREKSWIISDKKNNIIWLLPFRETYLSIRNETDKIQYKLVYYYR